MRHALLLTGLLTVGCVGNIGDQGEQPDEEEASLTSGKMVGDWSALPNGYECLAAMQLFYPKKFGVALPLAPDGWDGNCAPEGACHLWLDARPSAGEWERITSGTPSTYDLIVYPPIGNDPWGHVAAVDHVENGKIFVMDDNYVAHHTKSAMPHTVAWPAYGWYHLKKLPKNGGNGGNPPPPAKCPSGDGLYCGGDGVGGDHATLYQCSGGKLSVAQKCSKGCKVMPPGLPDKCR